MNNNNPLSISQNGIDLIKQFEGCKLTAYQDQVGVWTIGYGHTHLVSEGQVITQEIADQFLTNDLWPVTSAITAYVNVVINQNQYDALCSFAFNLGINALKQSTLLRDLNLGNFGAAANQLPLWDHAGKVVDTGLLNRRLAEQALFLS